MLINTDLVENSIWHCRWDSEIDTAKRLAPKENSEQGFLLGLASVVRQQQQVNETAGTQHPRDAGCANWWASFKMTQLNRPYARNVDFLNS